VRTSSILSATLAAILGMAPLSAATFVENLPVQSVELQDVLSAPQAYLNQRVKFLATFIELTQIYDPTHSPFTPERYLNFAVWDDDARIFEPDVRAKPVVTFYFDKKAAGASTITAMRKYDVIEIIADVPLTSRNMPWFNVYSVRALPKARSYSENSIYHIEQANSLAKEGSYDLADARYASALSSDLPSSAAIAVDELRARNLMAAGAFARAAKTLSNAISIQSDEHRTDKGVGSKGQAQLHYLLAKSQGEIAEDSTGADRTSAYEAAVSHARKSIALDPTQGDTYAVLGIALAGLGKYDDARRECAQAIRLQPANAEVRWYLGRILDRQGAQDEAIEALTKAIDLTPKDFRVHKAIAAGYHHRALKGGPKAAEDLSKALSEYSIALRLNPTDVESAYESAMVTQTAVEQKAEVQIGSEHQVPDGEAVIARLQAALKIDPKHAPTQVELAKRFAAAGRVDDSVALLTGIIAADPNRLDAHLQLAQLQAGKGDGDAALATLDAYRAKHPKDATILVNYGRLALAAGKPEKGIPVLEQFTKDEPKNVDAQLDLAESYLAVGRTKDALRRARIGADYASSDADKARAEALVDRASGKAPKAAPKADAPLPAVSAPAETAPVAAPTPIVAPEAPAPETK
jgi:tetratricopeptide (TPR) repeat protein